MLEIFVFCTLVKFSEIIFCLEENKFRITVSITRITIDRKLSWPLGNFRQLNTPRGDQKEISHG